ncbi:hypothetical protein [Actinoplanes sp. NPDC026623]|uniref:hypothetical protein n=1 Tax=Actinoplanes sp. NPDC026623 TaxID=3155610 RepID=UPI0033CDED05
MSSTDWDGRRMTDLRPPRRNRYFYGQLMDVRRFSMEQQYALAEQRQLNRLVLGPGVVCGLGVSAIQAGSERGLRVRAGVATDGWGRRIVVPDDHDLIPLGLSREHGVGSGEDGAALPRNLVVRLCYRECQAEFGPAFVPDPVCDGLQRCEAGTWIETYDLDVREGTADDVTHPCDAEIKDLLHRGRLHEALCALTAACATAPDDPCLVLARVTVEDDGSLTVIDCAPRQVVPTNQALLRLIACLAERIEECCGTPPPTGEFLAVEAVALCSVTQPLVSWSTPSAVPTVGRGREANAFEVRFIKATADQATAVPGKTVLARHNGTPLGGGTITWPAANRMRFSVEPNLFEPGEYEIELRGDHPAVMSLAGPAGQPPHALDGDPAGPTWPSGDGISGGNLVCRFVVTD